MPPDDPLVSIGVPVRNGGALLRRALEALRAQTYPNLEIVISDNASTDDTQRFCEEVARDDLRVRYDRKRRDIGAVDNFNDVLARARGSYFMWAAHDDHWEPTFVASLAERLNWRPDAVLAFSCFDNIDEKANHVRVFDEVQKLGVERRATERALRVMSFPESLGKANLVYGLMRTDVLRSLGGFKEWTKGGWGADCHLVFELAWKGPFVHVPDLLFHKTLPSVDDSSPGDPVAYAEELAAYAWIYPRLTWRASHSVLATLRAAVIAERFARRSRGGQITFHTGLRRTLRRLRASLRRRRSAS